MLTSFVLSIALVSAMVSITCKGISRGGAMVACFCCREVLAVRFRPPHPNI